MLVRIPAGLRPYSLGLGLVRALSSASTAGASAEPAGTSRVPAAAGPGSRGVADGRGAAAQAGRRVCLVPGSADCAGQLQGLLVTRISLGGFTAEPVQRPYLVESCNLSTPVGEVAVDGQGLLQLPGRAVVITHLPPHSS